MVSAVGQAPLWVNHVTLAVDRPFLVCPDQQTFSKSVDVSQGCQNGDMRLSRKGGRFAIVRQALFDVIDKEWSALVVSRRIARCFVR
jgi:hypothetical protein